MTRQSDYKFEYDEQVVEWLAEGKTLASFAKKIGVNNSTLWRWSKIEPTFCNAIKDGHEIATNIHAPQFMLDAVRDSTVQSVPFVMYCRNVLKLKTKDESAPALPTDSSANDVSLKLIEYIDNMSKK
jgi:hypothetical protein